MTSTATSRPETVAELLSGLSSRGIHLWLEGDALRYRAPRTGLTPEVRDQLKRRKEEIIDLLRKRSLVVPVSGGVQVTHDAEGRYEPFPLSDIQQAYWLGSTSAFELGNVSAHLYMEREVDDLDLDRLEEAWNLLVERHDMLRVRVTGQGEQQVAAEVPRYRIETEDLRSLDADAAWQRVRATREQMAENGPPLDRWPLFELRASQLEGRTTVIHLSLSLLIGDALSSQVLYNELLQLYQQLDAALPSLDITFRDVLTGLDQVRQSEGYQRSLEYWRERLDTLPPAPELPLAKSPGSLEASRFVRRSGRLTGRAWQRLRERASDAGLTPTAVTAAVYCEVLARWSKRQSFLLNVLFFNRLAVHPQVHRLVGNFSSTILLEVDARDGEASFTDRVRTLQDQLWSDIENAQVSGVQVLRELNQRQGGGARPAVPIVFASTLNLAGGGGGAAATTVQEGRDENPDRLQTPQVWIDHQVSERGGALEYNWDAVEELFAPGFLDQLFAAYEGMLQDLAAEETDWNRPPRDLLEPEQLVPRQQRNATEAPLTTETLHGLFCRSAAEHAERPAVIADRRTLSYGEVFLHAEEIAERVTARDAQKGELVAMVMEKGWEQVVAALGIQFAGAAYLPIQAGLPTERIHYLLDHGQVRTVLTQPELVDRLDWPEGVEVLAVSVDEIEGRTFDPARAANFHSVQAHDDLAYVIYTSGSTGLPKGVMIDHRGAVNTVLDINRRFEVGPDDRVLALSSMSFDLSVYDVFGMLAVGGALVIPEDDALREPARWVELVERHRISMWNTVPALMVMQVDYLEGHGAQLASSLRVVMMSGDWIPVALPDRIRALAPAEGRSGPIQVISLGGATEASIWSILYPIEAVDPSWVSIPYGAPMDNQRFHVLNDRLEHAPVWVPGHLYIAGVGVALGYWRDSERTHASFITHPETGERLYRTGDLGRYLPDGHIEFLGREDFQVKIQGYRIELGEIETALGQHPAVRDAVVVAVGRKRGAKRLVGHYIVEDGFVEEGHSNEGDLAQALHDYLATKLPDYMVPAILTELDEFPLTGNGKVDRSALAEPTSGAEVEHVPPRDEVESTLCRIWEELLERSEVGIREGFFDLGGHSLMAVRLMTRIEQELGRELPLSVLFEAPTVEQLAELVRGEAGTGPRRALVTIQGAGDAPPFFSVHPVGGNVLCYRDLSRELGDEQPFFALQARGAGEDGDTTVEALAADYLESIRQVQPEGPYHLGGWSMGGVVAYEMARQLRAVGEEVANLLMIDAINPQLEKLHARDEVDDAVLLAWFARDLAGLDGRELELDPAELRSLSTAEGLAKVVSAAHAAGALPEELGVEALEANWRMFRHNFRALLLYHPSDYDRDLDLFIAEDTARQETDASLGWGTATTGDLRLRVLPGNHFTVVQPPRVAELARHLRERLVPQPTPA